jgi:hypothetical protein
MANEIQITFAMQVRNGSFKAAITPGTIAITQTNIGRGGYTQKIGTSEEVVSFGDVATNGYMVLQNLDTTHYVTYGPESLGAMVVMGKLKPGELAVLRVAPTVVMRAKADTAQVILDVSLFED